MDGALNVPKYLGGSATTGAEAFTPGTNDEGWADRDADGDDFIRLPCNGRGTQEAATRRKEEVGEERWLSLEYDSGSLRVYFTIY
ncbi:hypothetical protein NDU88_001218 [Pleurodeles waltl]|uniref:Uncharacterized protein n=1 Tax=Pleurodeles waltl TaxID=8319 RepID=A0AAV7U6Y3_PLEWA|nr:hypothetical protein NDU88_001218 [Pleurodeles waltl]